ATAARVAGTPPRFFFQSPPLRGLQRRDGLEAAGRGGRLCPGRDVRCSPRLHHVRHRGPPRAGRRPGGARRRTARRTRGLGAAGRRAGRGHHGLLGFGVAFGVAFAAMTRSVTRVSRRAEGKEIEVAEKGGAITGPAYLEGIPRSLVDKPTLDRILAVTPVEEWDDPSEESPLYVIKLLSETYGPGKATKMRFSDFAYIKNQCLPADAGEVEDPFVTEEDFQLMMSGKLPLQIPGPAGWWDAGFTINFQGPERFSGDQIQTAVRDSAFSQQFLDNLAFYRQGLKPWQRGLEIGMAHGYFIIGPFVSLGPLRNTPEAATVGMLSGIAVIMIASFGGLLLGTTLKPTLFDKPGDKPAAGFQENDDLAHHRRHRRRRVRPHPAHPLRALRAALPLVFFCCGAQRAANLLRLLLLGAAAGPALFSPSPLPRVSLGALPARCGGGGSADVERAGPARRSGSTGKAARQSRRGAPWGDRTAPRESGR
ncbi:unnamed protein product, partial [Prorocentrum cordatum]